MYVQHAMAKVKWLKGNLIKKEKIYIWDDCPNIDMLDKRIVWWNEEYICIRERGE